MSKLSGYLDNLPITKDLGDGIVKIASLRKFVMCLPSPDNIERDEALIPDLDMKLIFSVSEFLPECISERVSKSADRIILDDKRLGGLCISGRHLPIEIFLHSVRLNEIDPTGALFDEIAWHETVHAIEGIWLNENGEYKRDAEPWSYRLQQEMIQQDSDGNFQNFLNKVIRNPQIIRTYMYLKQGTDIQEHVSEMFARAAVLFMKEIKNTGQDISANGEAFLRQAIMDNFNSSASDRDAIDLHSALKAYNKAANQLFFSRGDEMMRRISILYGCKTAPQVSPALI